MPVTIGIGKKNYSSWSLRGRVQSLLRPCARTVRDLSTLARERRPVGEADRLLRRISLFSPEGSLRAECEETLSIAYLRGADLWHVAAALSLAGRRGRRALTFCTLHAAQAGAAKALGFPVAPT